MRQRRRRHHFRNLIETEEFPFVACWMNWKKHEKLEDLAEKAEITSAMIEHEPWHDRSGKIVGAEMT